ncbi:MAG TPA: hypothetical protein VFX70_00295 [Mycobacteriales bacterium]|nr:hypothetical protein [Mycobacteriales bacterium]
MPLTELPFTEPIQPAEPHDARCAHELRGRLLAEAGHPIDPPTRLRHRIADAITDHCGHSLLRSHRLAWGWSVREAVTAAHALCREQGRACALADRLWEKWEKGAHPGAYYQDLLARLFRTRPDRLGLAADYTDYTDDGAAPDSTPRPLERTISMFPNQVSRNANEAHEAHESPAGSGESHRASRAGRGAENEITMSARESAYYHSNLSDIGSADTDLLRDEVVRVAGLFANAPRLAVFARTRALRDHTFALLDRRLRAEEFADLYFLAGAACGMLAEITHNLGYQAEAMAHARTAFLCADQVGHSGLLAWILGEQSVIAYYDGRPAQAALLAQRGQMHDTTDSFRAELPALEARATAMLGDTETAQRALARIEPAREQVEPHDLDDLGGIFGCILPKQQFYTADTSLWIGDGAAAVADAEACIAGYQDGPEQARAHDNEASAHVTLAMAHVDSGDLDAAREAAQPAFGIAPNLRTDAVNQRFRRLHRRLTAPPVRESPTAVELRDQIEDLLTTSTPNLPA